MIETNSSRQRSTFTSTWAFLREAARDPRTIGAVAPSGAALGRLLTEPVREQTQPLEVMEVGGGTGSVTAVLMPLLTTHCHLDIVEPNPRFAEGLRLLTRDHTTQTDKVIVHNTTVEQIATGRRYDVITSGLPFTNFEPEHVDAIMSRYLELLRPGGTLTYFAYRGTAKARSLFSGRAEARRHRAVNEIMAEHRRRYEASSTTTWANLPAAEVFRLQRPAMINAASGQLDSVPFHRPAAATSQQTGAPFESGGSVIT